MRYTPEQHKQTAKVYADLLYNRATLEECRSALNVPTNSGVYRNIEQNVKRIGNVIRKGSNMWKMPLSHVSAMYANLAEEDQPAYLNKVIDMAKKYDKTDIIEWARMSD